MIVEFRPVEPTERNGLISQSRIEAWPSAGQQYAVQTVSTRLG